MKLFKYLSNERIDILEKCRIRFSQPNAFNDPFEFLPSITSIDTPANLDKAWNQLINENIENVWEALSNEQKNNLPKQEFMEYVYSDIDIELTNIHKRMSEIGALARHKIYETANSNIGVLSLTEKGNNLLMWAHYADSHTGYCIAFDTSHSFFHRKESDLDELRHPRKVIYRDERPKTTLKQLEGAELLLTKSTHWEYEDEWRMCMPLSDAEEVIETGTDNVYLFKFPETAILEVILGANATDTLTNSVKEAIKSNPALKHVVIKKARIHDSRYELEFDEVS
ncbi:DUF2971 domain-containing protein [Vibrio parahaemolyticus]|uniref:DUF2971 domain-containing protein n=1 Tax=Vibrio parahaemolyticus TaxID=670 RepID=UPI003B66D08F